MLDIPDCAQGDWQNGEYDKLTHMEILTVDIGTGTQDIYLYNSRLDMENNFKLVVPSPTMIIRHQVRQATEHRQAILLDGVTMGGGPVSWAVEDHLREGLAVYATSQAARTINDDLGLVEGMGVTIISDDEAKSLPGAVLPLKLQDFDFPSIKRAFQSFGVSLDSLDAVAVGVFDHGSAPHNVSDRQFRFDYLDERIRKNNRLSAFAFRAKDVPVSMTRMQSVVESAHNLNFSLVIMDTAPAAILGATLDPAVAAREQVIIANIGNFHTLAFRLGRRGVEGLFEHHTGFLDKGKLEHLLRSLADGSLRREEVFNDQGHGALVYDRTPMIFNKNDFDVVITGPRRGLFSPADLSERPQSLRPYFPAPFGDMMITGCFGILAAVADVMPELAEPVWNSLHAGNSRGIAPWELG